CALPRRRTRSISPGRRGGRRYASVVEDMGDTTTHQRPRTAVHGHATRASANATTTSHRARESIYPAWHMVAWSMTTSACDSPGRRRYISGGCRLGGRRRREPDVLVDQQAAQLGVERKCLAGAQATARAQVVDEGVEDRLQREVVGVGAPGVALGGIDEAV